MDPSGSASWTTSLHNRGGGGGYSGGCLDRKVLHIYFKHFSVLTHLDVVCWCTSLNGKGAIKWNITIDTKSQSTGKSCFTYGVWNNCYNGICSKGIIVDSKLVMSGRSNQRRLRSLKRNRTGVMREVALHMKRIRPKVICFMAQRYV